MRARGVFRCPQEDYIYPRFMSHHKVVPTTLGFGYNGNGCNASNCSNFQVHYFMCRSPILLKTIHCLGSVIVLGAFFFITDHDEMTRTGCIVCGGAQWPASITATCNCDNAPPGSPPGVGHHYPAHTPRRHPGTVFLLSCPHHNGGAQAPRHTTSSARTMCGSSHSGARR